MVEDDTELLCDEARGVGVLVYGKEELCGLAWCTECGHESTKIKKDVIKLGGSRLAGGRGWRGERASDAGGNAATCDVRKGRVCWGWNGDGGSTVVCSSDGMLGGVGVLGGDGHVGKTGLHGVHPDCAHPAAVVELALDVDGDEGTPGRVSDDDVEVLYHVSHDEPCDAVSPQCDGLFDAECLCEELPPAEMEGLDVGSDGVKQGVVTTDEVVEHEAVPFPEGGGDLIDEGLLCAGHGVVAGLEGGSRGKGLLWMGRGGGRVDACGVDEEGSARRLGLVRRRGQLEGLVVVFAMGDRGRGHVGGHVVERRDEVGETAFSVGELVADVDVGGGEDADEDLLGVLDLGGLGGGRGVGGGPGDGRATGRADDIADDG